MKITSDFIRGVIVTLSLVSWSIILWFHFDPNFILLFVPATLFPVILSLIETL